MLAHECGQYAIACCILQVTGGSVDIMLVHKIQACGRHSNTLCKKSCLYLRMTTQVALLGKVPEPFDSVKGLVQWQDAHRRNLLQSKGFIVASANKACMLSFILVCSLPTLI